MAEKINVPYVAIVAYGAFVLVATLLVGLLPPLVNRPTCKPEPTLTVYSPPSSENIQTSNRVISKRSFNEKPILTKNDKNRKQFKQPGYTESSRDKFDKCGDVQNPLPDVDYPWYSPNLDNVIFPVEYDIEMTLPTREFPTYVGFITIHFNVTKNSEYLLLQIDLIQDVVDGSGKPVRIACVDRYPLNDYLIIKTRDTMVPEKNTYSIEIKFVGSLSEFDSGLFSFEFDNYFDDKS